MKPAAKVCLLLLQRQADLLPNANQRLDQVIDHGLAVMRIRHDPQAFSASRDRRVIDRLNVDRAFGEQTIADLGRLPGVADQHRHNVRGRLAHHRQTLGAQASLHKPRVTLVSLSQSSALVASANLCARQKKKK